MSALLPKADILGRHEKGLLLTHSGHSLDYAVQQIGTEESGSFVNITYLFWHITFDGFHL